MAKAYLKIVLLGLGLFVFLAVSTGCGQKGDLYFPDPQNNTVIR